MTGRPRATTAIAVTVTAAAVAAADQAAKALAVRPSGGRATGAIVPIRNSGLLSGAGAMGRIPVCVLAALVLAAFGAFVVRRVAAGRLSPIAAGLLLGGGAANLADRVALGGVRDFLVVAGWAVNLADLAVVAGLLAYAAGSARAAAA